jgi:hypothetical protein
MWELATTDRRRHTHTHNNHGIETTDKPSDENELAPLYLHLYFLIGEWIRILSALIYVLEEVVWHYYELYMQEDQFCKWMQLWQIVLARRPKGFRLKTSNGTPPFDSESGTKFYILATAAAETRIAQ